MVLILAFLFRRIFMHIRRFSGIEMKHKSHMDANFALTLIFLLMVSLLGMNTFYILSEDAQGHDYDGMFPVSKIIAGWFSGLPVHSAHLWHEINWWAHILWIFLFANVLPYSKHFHVFMSVPNVFLSRLEPLGYLDNMPDITKEVKLMMDPNAAFDTPAEEEDEVKRFGVLDVEDVTWKNYLDSLACTECGRCTDACPANITGKKLSPRKIIMDVRARMKEKGPGLVKDASFDDQKALIRDYISEEELWACTTCNACAQECPININHPTLIVDIRRYLVMEESKGPAELNAIFTNIENNLSGDFHLVDSLYLSASKIAISGTDINNDGRTELVTGELGGGIGMLKFGQSQGLGVISSPNQFFRVYAYPNPARSAINLEFRGFETGKMKLVSIISLQGEVLKVFREIGAVTKLSLENLDPGIYFIKIKAGEFQTVQKLMVQ
jgi:heterodisulfide reductase subunit C